MGDHSSYRLLVAATAGQFALWLLIALIGAAAMPCCENPSSEIPRWYALLSTPLFFSALLVPGFVCGFVAPGRPVLMGALAGLLGSLLWFWLGSFLVARLVSGWATGGLEQIEGLFHSLANVSFLGSISISSLCNAAGAAAAASGGVLARMRAAEARRTKATEDQ